MTFKELAEIQAQKAAERDELLNMLYAARGAKESRENLARDPRPSTQYVLKRIIELDAELADIDNTRVE